MRVGLLYKAEAYSSTMDKLMGRNVAGSTFLTGLLEHGNLTELALFVDDGSSQKAAAELAKNLSGSVNVNVITGHNLVDLTRYGNLFMPGPGIAKTCFQRSFFGHSKWSNTGITHTTSSARAMDNLGELMTGPIQCWDALICTSEAVKSHVFEILSAKKDYLAHRFGITKVPPINLPVIPLGVASNRFSSLSSSKIAARKQLKISQDEVVISFVGRLSWHAKAHPIPMYLAAYEVAKRTGKKITLIECGWHTNEHAEKVFYETQSIFSDKLKFIKINGRKPSSVDEVYAASDIFISLSDNIQETFGITPIEAMATGLPVIVSDWDGYRQSVRDGVDGFRIRTLTPASTSSQDLIYRYEMNIDTYDYYCGYTSMSNIVDVAQLTEKLQLLTSDSDLRRKFGSSGKKRVKQLFDWSVIIKQYCELWEQLDDIRRKSDDELLSRPTIWPERLDPNIGFKGYPTQKLQLDDLLECGNASGKLMDLVLMDYMVTYAQHVVAALKPAKEALSKLGPKFTAKSLATQLAPGNLQLGMRLVASLAKFDVVRLTKEK